MIYAGIVFVGALVGCGIALAGVYVGRMMGD